MFETHLMPPAVEQWEELALWEESLSLEGTGSRLENAHLKVMSAVHHCYAVGTSALQKTE